MVTGRMAAGSELRAETTASVNSSTGGGLLAPPPNLDGARRRTVRGPARPRPGIDTGGAGSAGHPVAPGSRPRPAANRAGPAAPPAPGPGDVLGSTGDRQDTAAAPHRRGVLPVTCRP